MYHPWTILVLMCTSRTTHIIQHDIVANGMPIFVDVDRNHASKDTSGNIGCQFEALLTVPVF